MGVASELKNRFTKTESKKIESISISDSICECGSNQRWLPKKSTEWMCYHCSPPGSDTMIAQTSWARQRIEMVSVETFDDDTIWTLQAQSWGPYIVCRKNWVCGCGCNWVEESGTLADVKSICVACRKETKNDLFR